MPRLACVRPGAGEDDDGEDELGHRHVVVTTSVRGPLETYPYRPVLTAYLAVVGAARRLQTGRLEAWQTYMRSRSWSCS